MSVKHAFAMTALSNTIDMPARAGKAGVLISAKTFFSDRFAPRTEHISLPEFNTPEGQLSYSLDLDSELKRRPMSRKARLKSIFMPKRPYKLEDNEVIVDFTRHSPENWAHTLDFYIPLYLYLRQQLSEYDASKKLVALLPENIPGYIKRVFEFFDLYYIASDRNILGSVLRCETKPFDCIRAYALKWLQDYLFTTDSFKNDVVKTSPLHGHKKLFISRRGGRSLKNEGEVKQILESRGFVTVYAEDLSPEDQIRSFVHCDAIVAIHGAAIAPLLYRQKTKTKLKLVEIFNAGHMTNFYRGMAGQVDCDWVGVRGKIESDWVKPSYDFENKFFEFSLSKFDVDDSSLIEALDMLGIG